MIPSEEVQAEDLERYRIFLHLRARRRLDPRLQAKLDAADIVQETLLQAFEKLGQLRGHSEAELAGWLRTILENTLAMTARRFRAEARNVARERSLTAGLAEAAAPAPPDEPMLRQEQVRHLADALEKLPPDQRRAIELHYLESQAVAAVAAHMHRSRAAVVGLLFRGLKKLRSLLAERAEG